MRTLKVVQMDEKVFDYLLHVVENYAKGGIVPNEGMALYLLWQAINEAQTLTPPPPTEVATNPAG
jgi:hypothetical protein